ncbi:hypothetical protein MPNT_400004 [Candidatus Methylacidithermus pantelleriae]|uniref:Uncharacterized protein n=1 Tax=Candidatus Methylacidithermus pantelleriae TaxID=2744239 RepID=A0A8J2BL00_9BACT|nr:hypothetical protein MPNT_400004 [Candidatus Methylacidithermus pantelleriae]
MKLISGQHATTSMSLLLQLLPYSSDVGERVDKPTSASSGKQPAAEIAEALGQSAEMVKLPHVANVKRLYDRPRRSRGLTNPGDLSTCVHVAVRPEMRVKTLETISQACPQTSPTQAGRAHGGSGIDVVEEGWQLPPRPAVPTVAHTRLRPFLRLGMCVRSCIRILATATSMAAPTTLLLALGFMCQTDRIFLSDSCRSFSLALWLPLEGKR